MIRLSPPIGSGRLPDPADRRGAPRSGDVRPLRPLPARQPTPLDRPIRMRVRDVLDFFEKCPECGYPAQASAVERDMASGATEVVVRASCGLPCGWQGEPRTTVTGARLAS
ncbi:hypothetical protein [Nocardia jiangsuensis]|uniref:Uncharacterized protein n=1 Tax=Nocardia jiangsuensis TaxID=1691563 RepID=A0ABV8DR10_9NOCA